MIDPAYCRHMARYNAWQNRALSSAMDGLSDAELRRERGAFFGSIFATANHLLWGDMIWISRFDGGDGPPSLEISSHLDMTPDAATWRRERIALDARIQHWADGVTPDDLEGDFTWYSVAESREMTVPWEVCVMQLFNHQTHHRGQIHAMLGAAGARMYTTDIPFMPEA